MKVTVYTEKTKLVDDNEIDHAYLPTLDGDLTILDEHNPIIGVLREGAIVLNHPGKEEIHISLDTGYFEFSNNELTIFVESTSLTKEDLRALQEKAIKAKKKSFGKEESISEEDFEERHQSEGF